MQAVRRWWTRLTGAIVNASLILFVKMTASSAAISRGFAADVVILLVSSSVA
jgi:hypothetical protein